MATPTKNPSEFLESLAQGISQWSEYSYEVDSGRDQTPKGDFGHHPRRQPATAPVENGKDRSKSSWGIVRTISSKTAAGIVTRNIRNITPLPINSDSTF